MIDLRGGYPRRFNRGRYGIRPDWEDLVLHVEERAGLVKSTQLYNCRTAVRTRGLIEPWIRCMMPDIATDHDYQAVLCVASLGAKARRFARGWVEIQDVVVRDDAEMKLTTMHVDAPC